MKLYAVTATAFQTVATRLGLRGLINWTIQDQIIPVSLVDSDVVLSATTVAPLFGTPASGGELVAPAANTRLADTTGLAAGNWTFLVLAGSGETTVSLPAYRVRRRNAADAADIWSYRYQSPGGSSFQLTFRTALANGERIVVENVAAGTGGVTYQASIFALAG